MDIQNILKNTKISLSTKKRILEDEIFFLIRIAPEDIKREIYRHIKYPNYYQDFEKDFCDSFKITPLFFKRYEKEFYNYNYIDDYKVQKILKFYLDFREILSFEDLEDVVKGMLILYYFNVKGQILYYLNVIGHVIYDGPYVLINKINEAIEKFGSSPFWDNLLKKANKLKT